MKTKQLIKEIKSRGFELKKAKDYITVVDTNGFYVAKTSEVDFGVLTTDYIGFYKLDYNTKLQLLNLLNRYAKTPIEDREEEEKYYYRLKGFGEEGYLNSEDNGTYLYVADIVQTDECQTQFTNKEFESLPYDVKMHNWKKTRVECED